MTDPLKDNLRLLAIFHYVVGGMAALFACLPFLHLMMGVLMLFAEPESGDEFPVTIFAAMFIIIPAIFILAGWAFAACVIAAGRKMAAFKSYTFCLVMAGILCAFVPFGTVLGVFSLATLTKPETKELFANSTSTP